MTKLSKDNDLYKIDISKEKDDLLEDFEKSLTQYEIIYEVNILKTFKLNKNYLGNVQIIK